MTERRDYDEQTRAAVMAALLAGQSVNSVAKEYKIPQSTVSTWKAQSPAVDNIGYKKRERIGDLIVDNLEAALETTRAILDVVKEKEWLRKQPATEIGVLYGIISDKTYRILEALPDEQTDL